MNSIILLLLVTVLVNIALAISSDSLLHDNVLHSRITVGQCRATCLAQTQKAKGDNDQEEDQQADCKVDGVCGDCWSQCARLNDIGTQAQISSSCRTDNTCSEGCQVACSSYLRSNTVFSKQRSSRRNRLEFSKPLVLSGCSVTWGNLRPSANSFKKSSRTGRAMSNNKEVIYLVLGRDRTGTWYEVNQTLANQAIIHPWTLNKLHEVHVIGVGSAGILTSKSVVVPEYIPKTCLVKPVILHREPTTGATASTTVESVNSGFATTEDEFKINLIGLEKLEDGIPRVVISWPESTDQHKILPGGVKYLIRWRQIPLGPVAGNMLTNSSVAKLPLLSTADVLVEVSRLTDEKSYSFIYLNKLDQQLNNLEKSQEHVIASPAVIVAILSCSLSILLIIIILTKQTIQKCFQKKNKTCYVENNNICNTIYSSKLASEQTTFMMNQSPTAHLDILNFQSTKSKNINIFNEKNFDGKVNF